MRPPAFTTLQGPPQPPRAGGRRSTTCARAGSGRRRTGCRPSRAAPAPRRRRRSAARGQRVRNRQPDGGAIGDGSSPLIVCAARGSTDGSVTGIELIRIAVYGCSGRTNRSSGRRHLADLAEVHHHDDVRHVLHDRQVVGDEDERDAVLDLEVLEQVEHLRLHRHVERRHRLVADDDLGVEHERPGDRDALGLAAGELVGAAVHRRVGVDADVVEHLADLGVTLLLEALAVAPDADRPRDRGDRHADAEHEPDRARDEEEQERRGRRTRTTRS